MDLTQVHTRVQGKTVWHTDCPADWKPTSKFGHKLTWTPYCKACRQAHISDEDLEFHPELTQVLFYRGARDAEH